MTTPQSSHHPHDPSRPGGTVLVLTGGAAPHPALALPPVDLVVAADSGALLAPTLGVTVDRLVGDLDSLSESQVAALRAGGTLVAGYPEDKDATDLELALATAVTRDPARIVVVGGDGGRIDHALANVGTIAAVATPGRRVEAWMGTAHIAVTVDEVEIAARAGETVSLIPLNGPVRGVSTEGLRWPLTGATLDAGTTWGVSNEATSPRAHITVAGGALAVIRPHALDPGADRGRVVPARPAVVDASSPLSDRRGTSP